MLSGTWDLNKYNLVLTNDKLGHGQFGQVKKGFVKKDRDHRTPVAVKSIKGNAFQTRIKDIHLYLIYAGFPKFEKKNVCEGATRKPIFYYLLTLTEFVFIFLFN